MAGFLTPVMTTASPLSRLAIEILGSSRPARSQATDILVRLALASGSELFCAIAAQCAACNRYVAAFSLPDIQLLIRLLMRRLTLKHRDLVSRCIMLAG